MSNEMAELREELAQMKEAISKMQGSEGKTEEKTEVKYRYGVRVVKLESGDPHIEFLVSEDYDSPVTLGDLAGLAFELNENLRFLMHQNLAITHARSRNQVAQEKEVLQAEVVEDDGPAEEDD